MSRTLIHLHAYNLFLMVTLSIVMHAYIDGIVCLRIDRQAAARAAIDNAGSTDIVCVQTNCRKMPVIRTAGRGRQTNA
jgi:hypothetical protein